MATTAEETTPTPVSTNVTESISLYQIGTKYSSGDLVRYNQTPNGDAIYSIGENEPLVSFDENYVFMKNDILYLNDSFYIVMSDFKKEAPVMWYNSLSIYNTKTFKLYLQYYWLGDSPTSTSPLTYYVDDTPGVYNDDNYTIFTQVDGAYWTKEKFKNSASTGIEDIIVNDSWEDSSSGSYFTYNGSLYQCLLSDDGNEYTLNMAISSLYTKYFTGVVYNFNYTKPLNQNKPFDDMNTSYATIDDLMQYSVSANADFNSFFLSGVTATSLTYTVTDGSDNTITETGTKTIDCKRDPDGLLPLGTVTVPVMLSKVYPAGSTIDIELINDGEIKLGHFSTNMAIDEGMTEFSIGASAKDYNDYTPDAWGNIEEGVKAKTKQLSISVKAPYDEFDMTYSRHMSYLGKFIAIDPTEIGSNPNSLSLRSLVLRGLILSINAKTLVKDSQMLPYYQWDMTFLEIV